jgi:molybdopterin biosynthesis enzyme MoaB
MRVRLLTVSATNANGKEVPALRLSGDWLAKQGFNLGKKVIVREQPGQLTIQLVSLEGGASCE